MAINALISATLVESFQGGGETGRDLTTIPENNKALRSDNSLVNDGVGLDIVWDNYRQGVKRKSYKRHTVTPAIGAAATAS